MIKMAFKSGKQSLQYYLTLVDVSVENILVLQKTLRLHVFTSGLYLARIRSSRKFPYPHTKEIYKVDKLQLF